MRQGEFMYPKPAKKDRQDMYGSSLPRKFLLTRR